MGLEAGVGIYWSLVFIFPPIIWFRTLVLEFVGVALRKKESTPLFENR